MYNYHLKEFLEVSYLYHNEYMFSREDTVDFLVLMYFIE